MGYLIATAHQKGGVGKSTIASNLLVEFNKLYKVRAIDLDFQESVSVFNWRRDKEEQFEIIDREIINIDFLNSIQNDEYLYIADCGGFDSDMNRQVLAYSDLIITPVSPDALIEVFGLQDFQKIIKLLKKVRPDIKSRVLLNKAHPFGKKNIEIIKDFIEENKDDFEIFDTIIRYRSDFYKAYNIGKSVVELNPNGKASMEIKKLIDEIKNILSL